MMPRLYVPNSTIIEETHARRVFYFHEFAYFVDTLDYRKSGTHDILKSYFTCLLLVFDEILIPLEHITISCSPQQAAFKARFLNSLFIRELISDGRLVTTRWDVCSDTPEHMEASDKYMHSIDADSFHFGETAKTAVLEMRVFRRDLTFQSSGVRDYTEQVLGEKDCDLLRYEDGPVVIPCSVESAILGKARDKLVHEDARAILERAYVRAMTIGNGSIYRAAVDSAESVRHSENILFDPLVPFKECQGVNPVLLRHDFLWLLLNHIGYQVPRLSSGVAKMKSDLVKTLTKLSLCDIESYEDFRELLRTIAVRSSDAALSRWLVFLFRYKDLAIDKFEELAEGREPAYKLVLDTLVVRVFNRSLKEGWQV
jgi:hypothetical protein